MTDAELLATIKTMLGISGTYQDAIITAHINTVKRFMRGAGVAEDVVNSEASVGCIYAGVNDLWSYSSGEVKFSDFFKMSLTQLASEDGGAVIVPNMELAITVPKETDLSSFGWTTNAGLANKNYYASDFTAADTETIKAIVDFADGTAAESENSGTGNRRSIRINTKFIMIMPDTKYEADQSKYCDCEGYTCIAVSVPTFCETKITLQTFTKAE